LAKNSQDGETPKRSGGTAKKGNGKKRLLKVGEGNIEREER